MKTPLDILADIAESQIGNHEDGDSNTGSHIAKYQAATELGVPMEGHGYPWCCAFVDWCILQTFEDCCPNCGHLAVPTTASVEKFIEWAKEHGHEIFHDLERCERGDIVCFHFTSGRHIGIVTHDYCLYKFETVEGNTSYASQRNGGEVMRRVRGDFRIECFIRLKVAPCDSAPKSSSPEIPLHKAWENGFKVGVLIVGGMLALSGCAALQNYQSHVAARTIGVTGSYDQSTGATGGFSDRVEYR